MNYIISSLDFNCLSNGASEWKSQVTKGNNTRFVTLDKNESIDYEFKYIYFYFVYSNLMFAKIYLETQNIPYQVLIDNNNKNCVIITDYRYDVE
jgi:hypothetical protein